MQIEPNENASKRMCTFQFSNRAVIAAASHSGTRRNIGLPRVEANGLALSTRFSVEPLDRHGFGLWAIELSGLADFIGFTGLSVPPCETHFTPCVEIAWRLARDYWGFGYATEAAGAARDYGFAHQGLNQIVSFTVQGNQRSRNVMERIGMTRSPDDDFQMLIGPTSIATRHTSSLKCLPAENRCTSSMTS